LWNDFEVTPPLAAVPDLERELDGLYALPLDELMAEAERAALDHRVSQMRPDHVDPDLLDSQVRRTLDVASPDEIVIIQPPQTPPGKP